MKTAVIGSRSFSDYKTLCETLDEMDITCIVSGGARGADSLSELYAKEKGIKTKIFYPDWGKHGKAAGPIRNNDIIKNSEQVVAFWDGVSRGTKYSIDLAKKLNIPVTIVKF